MKRDTWAQEYLNTVFKIVIDYCSNNNWETEAREGMKLTLSWVKSVPSKDINNALLIYLNTGIKYSLRARSKAEICCHLFNVNRLKINCSQLNSFYKIPK